METVIWIVGVIGIFVYTVSPIIVRFSLKQRVPTHMEVLSWDSLPGEVRDFFEATGRRLESAGFSHDVILRIRALSPNLFTLACFYGRPEERDAGH